MVKAGQVWVPKIKHGEAPVYQLIANAIASDIEGGQLIENDRLPPQRTLAKLLDIDFTTVARGYTEARRRGLVDSVVGRGTFVCGRPHPSVNAAPTPRLQVDMSFNAAPMVDAPELMLAMQQGWASIGQSLQLTSSPQGFSGAADDRAAAALWLRRREIDADAERCLVTPGAQAALLALLTTLAPSGSTICCESLTYPGLRALAAQLDIKLVGLPLDDEGIDAAAFSAACETLQSRALYCNPTFLNPTTGVMSQQRRYELVSIARRYGVPIIEDDAYGFLPRLAPPPIAHIGPDVTYHIASLSKSVSPGLRIAYLVAPDSQSAGRLATALRATTLMASPLMSALASRWIYDGVADAAVLAIRKESVARQKIAARILPEGSYDFRSEALHIWIKLPRNWTRKEFAAQMAFSGVSVVTSDAFAVGIAPPEAVRVCLGGANSRAAVEYALARMAEALQNSPQPVPAIV